ncbi:MAG: L-fucose:H+ symporter permease [Bacteroidia bacterium]
MNKDLRNLLIISVLFFMFGFVTNLNDILMPHLKRACQLNDFESTFVQFAFFLGYFIMSIPSEKIIKRIGYKKGITVGLLLCACGALIFTPAANTRFFGLFLVGLCVLASGMALLQVAANPYVSLLGKPEGAASRLSLMGGLNSLGASLGPFAGGILILSGIEYGVDKLSTMPVSDKIAYLNSQAQMVKMPYLLLFFLFLILAIFIFFSKLPEVKSGEEKTISEKKFSIWNHPALYMGVIAIFFYVGAEVCIGSFLIRYGESLHIAGFTDKIGSHFVSYYMICAMLFRFVGIAVLKKINPLKVLLFNAIVAIALIVASVLSSNYAALYIVVLVGACNSIMWPVIFPKAIEGLGNNTSKGSSYLIMAIIGGALITSSMGYFSDKYGVQHAYLVPIICYVYIAYYAFRFKNKKTIEV